ncbi:MAG: DNA repair protein RecN [Chlorobiaceae bacterium]|nr:DNA repair protein RecN [Chlorobiaceae bacterium]
MLFSLYIRNFALIRELSLEFKPGLTIITGETGAGKSILLGALGLILGERASSELVRSESGKAVIEAVLRNIDAERIGPILGSAEIETAPELIIRREISSSGQSRCFVNDTPCTAALLKQLGEQLIDLHGQHEHQQLLHQGTHESMLDDYAGTTGDAAAYRNARSGLGILRQQLKALEKESLEVRERKGMLEYQFEELSALDPGEDEDVALGEEITLLENAETLFSLGSALGEQLYEGDTSIYQTLSSALQTLEKLAAIDKRFEPFIEEIRNAKSNVDELHRFNRRYVSDIDFNPSRLDELRERMLLLQRTCKKYALSLTGLIGLRKELEEKLDIEGNLEEKISRLEEQIAHRKAMLSRLAGELSLKRRKAAAGLEREILRHLSELGIPRASFIVSITNEERPDGEICIGGKDYASFDTGYDRIEFLISANPGEKPKPLAKIASGGEISRVMLAMKNALAASARLPILIFDEIDTGISGRIADAVGKCLRNLSKLHQIIAITHLPQIAAMGDLHLSVWKSVKDERTETEVTVLDRESRLQAIAGLISGRNITPASITLARELLERAGQS